MAEALSLQVVIQVSENLVAVSKRMESALNALKGQVAGTDTNLKGLHGTLGKVTGEASSTGGAMQRLSSSLSPMRAGLESVKKSAEEVGNSLRKVNQEVGASPRFWGVFRGSLGTVKSALDGAKKSLEGLLDRVKELGATLSVAGGAVVATFSGMIALSTRTAGEIERLHKVTGLSRKELFALSGALEDTELNLETIARASVLMGYNFRMFQRMLETRTTTRERTVGRGLGRRTIVEETTTPAQLQQLLGLSPEEYRVVEPQLRRIISLFNELTRQGKSTVEVFLAVAQAVNQIPDAAARQIVAATIFRGAAEEVLKLSRVSSAELQQVIELYRQTAPSEEQLRRLDELGDSFTQLGFAFKGLIMSLVAELAPILLPIIHGLTQIVIRIKQFVEAHPILTRVIMVFGLLAGVVMMAVGAVLGLVAALGWVIVGAQGFLTVVGGLGGIIGAIVSGLSAIGGLLAAGFSAIWAALAPVLPIVLVVVAIVGLLAGIAYLVWRNWDKIKGFFVAFWDGVKVRWAASLEWLRGFWERLTTGVKSLWDRLKGWVSSLWGAIKTTFSNIVQFVLSLPSLFVDAGKRLVESIAQGIWQAINKPIGAIKALVQKIRNFLPFSPAKEGALRDLPVAGEKIPLELASGIQRASFAPVGAMAALTENILGGLDWTKAATGGLAKPVLGSFSLATLTAPSFSLSARQMFFSIGSVGTLSGAHHIYTIQLVSQRELDERIANIARNVLVRELRKVMMGR